MRFPLTDSASLPHRASLWLALWLFALGTSVTLVAGWGRSLTTDQGTLTAAAERAVASETVQQRLGELLVEGIADSGASTESAQAVVDELWSEEEVRLAASSAIAKVATAAATEDGEQIAVDVRDEVGVIAPPLEAALERHGFDGFDAAALEEHIAPIAVGGLASAPVLDTVSSTRNLTTMALVFGLGVMLAAGLSALNLTNDRTAILRTLASRIATSAVTFGVMLQLGGWALDPSGGGASVRGGSAVVLRSNVHIPLLAALGAVFVASVLTVIIRRRGTAVPDLGPVPQQRTEELRQPALIR